MAYSIELRQRVLSSIEKGLSKQEIARRFDLSYGTVCLWHKLAQHGITSPGIPGPKKFQPVAAHH
ncbi:helix-turn-helix domain-containing protein [Algisphaera agarilytica]|uniref:Transposase n=1 Tax=Algisphaera agarilytica TaxID=1385975 RepID=A0A7X0H5D0_9BACT|nr:helix-turn-helix domain-containing protein [Algisphaera agarilytica]MBB6429597.1 transposase [Algisphaera agarilytica]